MLSQAGGIKRLMAVGSRNKYRCDECPEYVNFQPKPLSCSLLWRLWNTRNSERLFPVFRKLHAGDNGKRFDIKNIVQGS